MKWYKQTVYLSKKVYLYINFFYYTLVYPLRIFLNMFFSNVENKTKKYLLENKNKFAKYISNNSKIYVNKWNFELVIDVEDKDDILNFLKTDKDEKISCEINLSYSILLNKLSDNMIKNYYVENVLVKNIKNDLFFKEFFVLMMWEVLKEKKEDIEKMVLSFFKKNYQNFEYIAQNKVDVKKLKLNKEIFNSLNKLDNIVWQNTNNTNDILNISNKIKSLEHLEKIKVN